MLDVKIPEKPKSLIPIISPNINIKSSDYIWNSLISKLSSLISSPIEEPKNNIKADLAIATFSLAKEQKQAPQEIAKKIIENFLKIKDEYKYIKDVEQNNGYVNFNINFNILGNDVLKNVENFKDNYGNQNIGNNKNIVFDVSSPNIAKFMSIGHLRSTVIGESLSRIYRSLGYTTIRDNHIGDWGTQFGMLGAAYEKWGDTIPELKSESDRDVVNGLYKLYVKIHQEIEIEKGEDDEKESELEKSGKMWFEKLEKGDPKAKEMWKWALDISLKEFNKIYSLMDIKFEYMIGESFYVPMIPELISKLLKDKIAVKDNTGAIIVNIDVDKNNKLVIQKTDGTSLYSARDLACLFARNYWFEPKKILYVVGVEQQYYFNQVFLTFNKLVENNTELVHVYNGVLKLPEGKMSTRKGNIIFLEEFLQKAINIAKEKIIENNSSLSKNEIDEIARIVGVGAVIFFDLGQNRERNIMFDWDTALSFEGIGAPYIQYAYTRAHSILEKAENEKIKISTEKIEFESEEEKKLIKQIAKFPQIIQKAANLNQPSVISEFAYEIASLFNQFYKNNPVLNAKTDLQKSSRLRITNATAITIKKALYLLGIDVPKRM